MWSQISMTILGIWLMAAPGVFEFPKNISDNAHIVGPLIVTFSIVALSECTRNVRFFNLPLAGWLLLAPWVLQYDNNTAVWNDYAVAILIIGLSFIKPKRSFRFGGGWPAAWKPNSLHARIAGNPRRIHIESQRK